jgi:hypothetical protein
MLQMAKVGVALVEGRTGDAPAGPAADAAESATANGPIDPAGAAAGAAPAAAAAPGGGSSGTVAVKPQAFKVLVGRGHPEFSSNRQQVRSEFGRQNGRHGMMLYYNQLSQSYFLCPYWGCMAHVIFPTQQAVVANTWHMPASGVQC